MFNQKKQKASSPLIPLMVFSGAMLGSAVTLLLAPQKGSASRQWLKNKTGSLKALMNDTSMGSQGNQREHPVSMHAVKESRNGKAPTSKATAMVNHLKHTHQDNGNQSETM